MMSFQLFWSFSLEQALGGNNVMVSSNLSNFRYSINVWNIAGFCKMTFTEIIKINQKSIGYLKEAKLLRVYLLWAGSETPDPTDWLELF